jgi:hypothetical protein
MKTWQVRLTLLLLTTTLLGILLINVLIVFHGVSWFDHLNYYIFANICAESPTDAPVPDSSVENETQNTTTGADGGSNNVKTDDTGSLEDDSQQTGEGHDDKVEKANKSSKKAKTEEVIIELPEKISRISKNFMYFPIDFKDLKLDSFGGLEKKEDETMEEYVIRLNRIFSAICTLHAAGVLENTNWKVLIEQLKLCSTEQVSQYQMKYLLLTEEQAVKNNKYGDFVKTPESDLLNSRRSMGVSSQNPSVVAKKDQLAEANKNYNWLGSMLQLKALEKAEYNFLKIIWENTIVDKSKNASDPTRLSEIYTEFYFYLTFPKELLKNVVVETGGDPEKFTDPKQVREWLFFLECLKKDPHFLDFKR